MTLKLISACVEDGPSCCYLAGHLQWQKWHHEQKCLLWISFFAWLWCSSTSCCSTLIPSSAPMSNPPAPAGLACKASSCTLPVCGLMLPNVWSMAVRQPFPASSVCLSLEILLSLPFPSLCASSSSCWHGDPSVHKNCVILALQQSPERLVSVLGLAEAGSKLQARLCAVGLHDTMHSDLDRWQVKLHIWELFSHQNLS